MIMEKTEAALNKAVDEGVIAGCVLLASNNDESLNYSKAIGSRSKDENTQLLQTSDVFSLISAGKILVSVAAMLLIERQTISIDDDIGSVLPELAALDILTGFDSTDQPILTKRQNPILVKHLLTHSCGTPYIDPLLTRYLEYLGRKPLQGSTILERFALPLLAEPGTSFHYGSGIDWTGKVIERVSGKTLQQFIQDEICTPLGIDDITFSMPELSAFEARRVGTSLINDENKAVPHNLDTINTGIEECFGGQSGHANLESLLRILHSLSTNDGKILKKETVQLMFTPLLSQDSKRRLNEQMKQQTGLTHLFADASTAEYDWSIAGRASLAADGSVVVTDWFGMFNTHWFINHSLGQCGLFGVQTLPMGHPSVEKLCADWVKEISAHVGPTRPLP